jgi:hypothetical protein
MTRVDGKASGSDCSVRAAVTTMRWAAGASACANEHRPTRDEATPSAARAQGPDVRTDMGEKGDPL